MNTAAVLKSPTGFVSNYLSQLFQVNVPNVLTGLHAPTTPLGVHERTTTLSVSDSFDSQPQAATENPRTVKFPLAKPPVSNNSGPVKTSIVEYIPIAAMVAINTTLSFGAMLLARYTLESISPGLHDVLPSIFTSAGTPNQSWLNTADLWIKYQQMMMVGVGIAVPLFAGLDSIRTKGLQIPSLKDLLKLHPAVENSLVYQTLDGGVLRHQQRWNGDETHIYPALEHFDHWLTSKPAARFSNRVIEALPNAISSNPELVSNLKGLFVDKASPIVDDLFKVLGTYTPKTAGKLKSTMIDIVFNTSLSVVNAAIFAGALTMAESAPDLISSLGTLILPSLISTVLWGYANAEVAQPFFTKNQITANRVGLGVFKAATVGGILAASSAGVVSYGLFAVPMQILMGGLAIYIAYKITQPHKGDGSSGPKRIESSSDQNGTNTTQPLDPVLNSASQQIVSPLANAS